MNISQTMSHSYQCIEGLILRVIPYGEYDQILSLFTAEAGVIKLFFKGSRSQKRGLQGICIPLTGVEAIYKEKNSELFSCHELTLLQPYRFLRQELSYLEAACEMLKLIDRSQFIGKPAPQLYSLLLYYLARLPECPDPKLLSTSFHLKLMKHEGLLSFPLRCSSCQEELISSAFQHQSESYCEAHRASNTVHFHADEIQLLEHLTGCQNFPSLLQASLSPEFKDKFIRVFSNHSH